MTDEPIAEHTISTTEALMAQGAAIVALQDEIAALKAERDDLDAKLSSACKTIKTVCQTEQRLKAALEQLIHDYEDETGEKAMAARRALEGK